MPLRTQTHEIYRLQSQSPVMQAIKLLSDCVPYSMVISSFSKNGDLQMVEYLFKEMITSGIHANVFL
jgi:pentatricopeptide repeat protein